MKSTKAIVAAAALSVLGGAAMAHSQIEALPIGTIKPVTDARMSNWQAMARTEAAELAPVLRDAGTWYISPRDGEANSRFADNFLTMLRSELVRQGVQIAATPARANGLISISYRSQSAQDPHIYKKGSLTLLAGGAWLVDGILSSTTPAGFLTLAAMSTDAYLSFWHKNQLDTGAELALTVEVVQGGLVKESSTRVYLLANEGLSAYDDSDVRSIKFRK